MATWRYIKGSEKDFIGAPAWATVRVGSSKLMHHYWGEQFAQGAKYKSLSSGIEGMMKGVYYDGEIIAHRERVTSINDDRLAHELRPRSIVKPDGTIEFGCIQTPLVTDNVNHPKHYTQGGIECIDAIKAATVGKPGIEAVCVANVVKYLWRYEEKNGVEDVKKARWYLERLIQEIDK